MCQRNAAYMLLMKGGCGGDVPLIPQQAERKIWLNNLLLILDNCVLLNRFRLDLAREQCMCLANYIILLLESFLDDQIKLLSGDGVDALLHGQRCGPHGSHWG